MLCSIPGECKKAVEGLKEKIYFKFIQTSVLVRLAVNSMLMKQQYTANKVALNTNTHKTKLYVKCCDQRITRT